MESPQVAGIDAQLRALGQPEGADKERAYLKSNLEHYGAAVPAIRSVARAVKAAPPDMGHDDIVALAGSLWAAPVHERRMVAVELLDVYGDRLSAADRSRFLAASRRAAGRAARVTLREAVKPLRPEQRLAVLPPGPRRTPGVLSAPG